MKNIQPFSASKWTLSMLRYRSCSVGYLTSVRGLKPAYHQWISHRRIHTYNEITRDLNIPTHLWSKCIPISPSLRLSFIQIILNHSLKQTPWWEANSSPESRNSPQFIRSKKSLPFSQQLATCPYPGRHKFSPSHTTLFVSHPFQYYPPIHASCWQSIKVLCQYVVNNMSVLSKFTLQVFPLREFSGWRIQN